MRILYSEQIKQLEDEFVKSGSEHIKLMENAGDCITRFIHEKYGIQGKSIAILCGKGNNGGDGFAAARKLLDNGAKVRVILVDGQPKTDDAIDMFGRAELGGVKHIEYPEDIPEEPEKELEERIALIKRYVLEADIVIDAIFGIGFHGEMPEHVARIVELTAMTKADVISIDIPSGVSADTGACAKQCVKAAYTLTFTAMKPAHVVYPSTRYCGTVLVAQIGISESSLNEIQRTIFDIDSVSVRMCFQPRNSDTHKGDYGKLLAICGSVGMAGAAVLACKSAIHSGVGLVRAAVPEAIYPIAASQSIESVFSVCKGSEDGTLSADNCEKIGELLKKSDACLIGCGLGVTDDTRKIVEYVIKNCEIPLIIDADALNVISENISLLREVKCPVIITPHIGEMARLIKSETEEVNSSRLVAATEFAKEFDVTVILKSANTIVAQPDGSAYVNLNGNPGMAKGGSGDVLSGIVASFAAQGMNMLDAATCAVYIHGAAGDKASARFSQHSVTPTDVIYELSTVFSEIEK